MKYSTTFHNYFLNTDHAGCVESPDVIRLYHSSVNPFDQFCFYIVVTNGIITCANFESGTTPALIAAGEYTCRWLEGKSIFEAVSLQSSQILQELNLDSRYVHIAEVMVWLIQQLKDRDEFHGKGSQMV